MNDLSRIPVPANAIDADLPWVLYVPDLVALTGLTTQGVRHALRHGVFGKAIKLGRRLAVRRDVFLRAVADQEASHGSDMADARGAGSATPSDLTTQLHPAGA